ncbi:uncharacterized protein FIBRA_02965 [Fibroporia radiculosa]|uniref:C2H2-type domain-containing protein n=1 Tax=Fibroporia radiculosa TaxID=599839 RepID=J4H252_9APHY|nr:uncharacterized protein FIBRA_02965 [Fibroporia radiculosa]CCM00919.1 predicted protein [Fibroporia radiculosa]
MSKLMMVIVAVICTKYLAQYWARAETGTGYFSTWSALQHHIRTAHPPTCPHPSCKGKTFTAQKGLRAHLKIHAERNLEVDLESAMVNSGDEDAERPRKRRRGGELGRDWICPEPACGKDFKSKKALTTHHSVTHLGRRDFICPDSDCQRAFGYKHLLQRHVAKVHALPHSNEDRSDSDEESGDSDALMESPSGIDFITGNAYAIRSQTLLSNANSLRCPYPSWPDYASDAPSGSNTICQYVFSRAYDLRRHMLSEHGRQIQKGVVDAWVRTAKQTKAVPDAQE